MTTTAALAAVILAGGQGKRMRSARPKVLHEIGGKPLVRYPVELARKLGAEPVVVVVGHGADAVRAALAADDVRTADQGTPRGTGHAVQATLETLADFDGPVVVLSGDVPLLSEETVGRLIAAHRDGGAAVTLLAMDLPDGGAYGRVLLDGAGRPARIVEARDASPDELAVTLVNVGLYVFDAGFLREALPGLDDRNAQGELYLTDLVAAAAERGLALRHEVAPDPEEVAGINNRAELAAAHRRLNRRTLEALAEAGVTVWSPESTSVEPGCEVGRDTVIEPGVHLRGTTAVGEGCRIEAGSILVNTRLGDRVHVRAYSVLESSVVADDAAIGPMAHLRPGSDVGAGARVGNFVEIKKSRLGPRTKAAHLTYLGDAEIGADVNVGCGTITCNYDGETKSRTEIADGVFVGSDTQLVAPVKVGPGAYIGSGSTITRDVPGGALAVTRAKQRNIEGWAERRRQRRRERDD